MCFSLISLGTENWQRHPHFPRSFSLTTSQWYAKGGFEEAFQDRTQSTVQLIEVLTTEMAKTTTSVLMLLPLSAYDLISWRLMHEPSSECLPHVTVTVIVAIVIFILKRQLKKL